MVALHLAGWALGLMVGRWTDLVNRQAIVERVPPTKATIFGAELPLTWSTAGTEAIRVESAEELHLANHIQSAPPVFLASQGAVAYGSGRDLNDIEVYLAAGRDIRAAVLQMQADRLSDVQWSVESIDGRKADVLTNTNPEDKYFGRKVYYLAFPLVGTNLNGRLVTSDGGLVISIIPAIDGGTKDDLQHFLDTLDLDQASDGAWSYWPLLEH